MNTNTAIPLNPASSWWKISSTFRGQRLLSALMAFGVSLCRTLATSAQSFSEWNTVDDIENGWQDDIVTDRAGNVFVSGDVNDAAGVPFGCVSWSIDRGETWTSSVHSEVETYTGIAGATIEIAPASETTPALLEEHLVVTGLRNGQWITRRSLNAGLTWETVDVFQHSTSSSSRKPESWDVAIDSAGNIFVVGSAIKTTVVRNKATSMVYWLIRKIGRNAPTEGEAGKTTFDLLETAKGGWSQARGIICAGSNVFIAGSSGDRWQVRKNTSGGGTWEIVDDFRYSPDYLSHAHAIAADNSGNIYVVGVGHRAYHGLRAGT